MVTESEAALARAVLIHGPLSRSALTARLGLSPASLTRLAKPLLDSGLLIELDDHVDGSVGRPSRPLDIAPGAGRVAGFKLTGDRIHAVVTDIRADVVSAAEHVLHAHDPEAVVEQIAHVLAELSPEGVTGVGVSLGGTVRGGHVQFAPFLGWTDVDLGGALSARLGVPVTVENDVVALAEAERWFGVGRGIPGFAVLTIGVGVGYALVIGGDVVRTPDAGIGSVAHVPLLPSGPLCADGHPGCSQALLTSGSIAAQVSAALQRPVSFEEVLDLAASGDRAARAVVNAAGDALGRFIALALNFTFQSSVVLAGEGIGLHELVADRVDAAIRAGRDSRADPVEVVVDSSGFRAWARGAAAVAIQAAMGRIRLSA